VIACGRDRTIEIQATQPVATPAFRSRPRLVGLAHIACIALIDALVLGSGWRVVEAAEPDPPIDTSYPVSVEQQANQFDVPVAGLGGDDRGEKQNELPGNGRPGGGGRAIDVEGGMGTRMSRADGRRYAIPVREEAPRAIARAQAREDAFTFGMIGLLSQGPDVPSAWVAAHEATGTDRFAANGSMWSRDIGDAAGVTGLGLKGIGTGGGGTAAGIGLERRGGVGHTSGPEGSGTGGRGTQLFGRGGWGSSRLGGGHRGAGFRHWGYGVGVTGRLPPETIQRIVRQNFGRLRDCYQRALQTQPSLAGRVVTRFVIARDGLVTRVTNVDATLPDRNVVACITRAFYGMTFPFPEGGVVTVTYPVVFSPG
jgi:hypothetical protein